MLEEEKQKIERWVRDAISKNYSADDIKKVLLKNNYNPTQLLQVLLTYNKIKSEMPAIQSPAQKKPGMPAQARPVAKTQESAKPQGDVTQQLAKKTESQASSARPALKQTQEAPAKTISPPPTLTKPKPKGEVIETYPLEIDKAKVDITIEKTEDGLVYSLYIPEIDVGTRALLEEIRKDLVAVTAIAGEIVDQKSVSLIKNRFMKEASKVLREKIPNIPIETEEFLIGILMQEMLGLGKIEFLANDPRLEEIVIVNSQEIRVYHKKYGWLRTSLGLRSEEEVTNYANIIARRVGRQITVLTPLLDAHIVTGDRANAVLYPIATKGNTITIRKFSRDPWTVIDLIENNTLSKDIAALLWLAIEYEMNIVFSGGTASGKTVALNACMPFIPPNHRIISIEDTRELMLPSFLYWCPLVTRTANAENKGEVSMLDLLVNSLRMRPDRIVLGEIRRQREAEVLFEAMHTGHSVYSTVHADTANETVRRLINPPINVPPSMLNSVNLNVVMFRDRRRGIRRIFQVAEFIAGKDNVTANILYRWVPEKDTFIAHNKSLAFFDTLSRNTGMDEREIEADLKYKKSVFEWLIKNKIRNIESFGKVMNLYYTDRERLNFIMKNNQVAKVLEAKKSDIQQ